MGLDYRSIIGEAGMLLGLSTKKGSEEETSLANYVNMFGRDLLRRHEWPQRNTETFVTTFEPYSTGTVTVTVNSASVTGSGTTWSSLAGHKFGRGYAAPWYRIQANGSATALTLTSNYLEDTAAGVTYVVFEDEYDVAATLGSIREVYVMIGNEWVQLDYVVQPTFDASSIVPVGAGIPRTWSDCPSTTAQTLRVRVSPVSDDVYRLRVHGLRRWVELTGDGDFHMMGEDFDQAMILGTALYAQRVGGNRQVTTVAEVDKMVESLWGNLKPKRNRPAVLGTFDAQGTSRLTYHLPEAAS